MRIVQMIALCCLAGAAFGQPKSPYKRIFVFGDSYSDIGEGYLDGNGPTAVAYLAQGLGITLTPSNRIDSWADSVDFAMSGAQTGAGAGSRIGEAMLGYGMKNQVDDFRNLVKTKRIHFKPEATLFYLAGGLNDRTLTTETTTGNLESEVRELYALGGRHFLVALMPTAISAFREVGLRLNPALAKIPRRLQPELPGATIGMSNWGPFFDEVIHHPAEYGITNTSDACAGRAIFHQDSTPCANPNEHFYYHADHPSTAVHKVVGRKLAAEITSQSK